VGDQPRARCSRGSTMREDLEKKEKESPRKRLEGR